MCGRFVSPDQAAIERAWHIGLHNHPQLFERRFNISPSAIVPILRLDPESGEIELLPAIWGLLPPWWKDPKPPRFTFNARIEEAAGKPMWRAPLKAGRCLVPAVGWYEWRKIERVDSASGEVTEMKQPYYIHSSSGRIFCFAGLMSLRGAVDPNALAASCAIITTVALPPVAAIHDRMPAVLPDEAHAAWMNPGLSDVGKVAELLLDCAVTDFQCHPVSAKVNDAKNDAPALIEPKI